MAKKQKLRDRVREDTIAEVCRVLKWHLGHVLVADQLWEAMKSGEELRQGPAENWVTAPQLEAN